MIGKFTLLLAFTVLCTFNSAAQFTSITDLNPIPIVTSTGEKPQSKVWSYGGKHWAVLTDNSGTQLWRLDGTTWTNVLKLSNRTTSKADCKLVGDVVHILLFQGASSELVSLEYDPSTGTYLAWSKRMSTSGLKFHDKVEAATIDIDGNGRMWLASDGSTSIYVNWSDAPYNKWSNPITVATGVSTDDIGAIIALPGKIGVLWSDQNTKRFGFKTHDDGADPADWTENEVPASQSALSIGNGMADDHLNMAVASNGTLFCAVKTSYDNSSYPEIGLLVRRPTGEWDDLYKVSNKGTRPIVILDETKEKVIVIYTSQDSGGDILYKESLTSEILFGTQLTLIKGNYKNPTSTKDSFNDEIVVLASNSTQAVGVLASNPISPLPVELFSFEAKLANDEVVLQWVTASELNNKYFSIEASADGYSFDPIGTVAGNGTTQLQSHYSFRDKDIYRYKSDWVYYRLRQVDYSGEETLSPVRAVQPYALEKDIVLEAFPNPFGSYLKIQISSHQAEQASLTLYNAQGTVVVSEQPILKVGQNHILLNGEALSQGIYYLSVKTERQQRMMKVLRQ